jgi:hypothetical protein
MTTIRKALAALLSWLADKVRPAGGGGPGSEE